MMPLRSDCVSTPRTLEARRVSPFFPETRSQPARRANATLAQFDQHYHQAYLAGLRRKLGLAVSLEGDFELASDLLARMAENEADFTATFRALCDVAVDASGEAGVRRLFVNPAAYDDWACRWRERLAREQQPAEERRARMRAANPMFIPRNHRIEAAIAEAEIGRFDRFHEMVDVLAEPSYEDQPAFAHYAKPPQPEEEVRQTFCGT